MKKILLLLLLIPSIVLANNYKNEASFRVVGDGGQGLANAKFELSYKDEETTIKEVVVSDSTGIVDMSSFINKLSDENVCNDTCDNINIVIKQLSTAPGYEVMDAMEVTLNVSDISSDTVKYSLTNLGVEVSSLNNKAKKALAPKYEPEENPKTDTGLTFIIVIGIIYYFLLFLLFRLRKKMKFYA